MAADTLRSRTKANRRRAVALVIVASIPLGVIAGLLFSYYSGWLAGIAALVAGTGLFGIVMWWAAEPAARKALGGRPADPVAQARLFNLVEGLCATIGTSKPELRVRDETTLNAAVCGRSRRSATLVVTDGLLAELTRVELEGVIAQQLTRIRCHDMLPATVTVVTIGFFATLLSPPEPVTAMDRAAVSFTSYPPGLIGALEKMEAKGTEVQGGSRGTVQLWFADPGGTREPLTSIKDRIEALREL